MQIPYDLTAPERRLWDAMETGEPVPLLKGGTLEECNPANGKEWGPERTVRSEALAAMLTQPRTVGTRPPRAARLSLARVTGALDLTGLDLGCPLELRECFFDEPVHLDDARVPKLALGDCRLPSLTANQLETRGDVNFDGSHIKSIEVRGATIGGQLSLDRARLSNKHGRALNAEGAQIDGNLSCVKVQAEGEIRLVGAHVQGLLRVSGAELTNPQDGAEDTRSALNADRACIDGDFFGDGFHVVGELRLLGAHIGGQFILKGAELNNPAGDAFSTDGADIAGDVICGKLRAKGQLHLLGTHIGGQLNFDGAQLDNGLKVALNAARAQIDEDVFFQECFRSKGMLCLAGTHIGGSLNLDEAKLSRPEGNALDLRQADIQHLTLPVQTPPDGIIDLCDARVTHLVDAWPRVPYKVRIDGLAYDTIAPLTIGTSARVDWITSADEGFLPQPYEQLATVLRRSGRDDDARLVAIAKEKARQKTLQWPGKLLSRFLRATVGYGYKPAQGIWWLAGLFLIDWFVFAWAKENGHLRAIYEKSQRLPQFHVSLYALDHVLPVIELGQRSYWSMTGFFQYWQTFSDLAGLLLVTVILGAVTARLVRS
jgi:hypothetical protein